MCERVAKGEPRVCYPAKYGCLCVPSDLIPGKTLKDLALATAIVPLWTPSFPFTAQHFGHAGHTVFTGYDLSLLLQGDAPLPWPADQRTSKARRPGIGEAHEVA